MPPIESPLSGNYMPEIVLSQLRGALERADLIDATRRLVGGTRSTVWWLGFVAFSLTVGANFLDSVVGDSAPPLPA